MMRFNILLRNFIYYALIIIFTTLIVILIASRELKKSNIQSLELSLLKQSQLIAASTTDLAIQGEYASADSVIKELAKNINTRITIIRIDGKVIGESEFASEKMEDYTSRPEFIQAVQTGVGKIIRFSKTTNQDMLYVAIPILKNNKPIAVIRTSSYLSELHKNLRMVNKKIIYSAIILTVLALLLAILSSRGLTKPIRVITNVAERIKNGDFNSRIISRRTDEIGRLSSSINEMAESLDKLFNSLTVEREEIRTILSSMTEGLIILDDKDRVILANDNFKNMISDFSGIIEGKYYWEVLQNSEFVDLIKQTNLTNIRQSREIEFKSKFYLANANVVTKTRDKKMVVVLHDITGFKNLAKVKSDFVANVSHELKTPLTSIKGFAETLAKESGKKYRKLVEPIQRNAERLINIVQDLLSVSELERKDEELHIEQVDLSVMLANIKKIFLSRIKEKRISFKSELSDDARFIKGDPFLIEQMLVNLIDNAIKYNVEKCKIRIKSYVNDNNIIIEIEDTGIGIAQEHLPRIFERFYVIDKSRSRKLGGTGLGLSIVKHIVLSHNGKIDVESELGKGTKFVITLPT
jgi:two-component system phosphate regulon sensor histidine kinase PhoR